LARLVTGALASGNKASRSVFSCLSDLNFKRTKALALAAIQRSLECKKAFQGNKQNNHAMP
jgi:hypothetical protein